MLLSISLVKLLFIYTQFSKSFLKLSFPSANVVSFSSLVYVKSVKTVITWMSFHLRYFRSSLYILLYQNPPLLWLAGHPILDIVLSVEAILCSSFALVTFPKSFLPDLIIFFLSTEFNFETLPFPHWSSSQIDKWLNVNIEKLKSYLIMSGSTYSLDS